MKEKVYVTVKGLHATGETQEDQDNVEVISVGTYKIVAGKEYIKYDELFEDGQTSKTIIKLTDEGIEMSKKGAYATQMSFLKDKKTMTYYETPFGNIYMGIYTKSIDVKRTENSISAIIDYSLEVNYQPVSESRVEIRVEDKAPKLDK